jgi:hypothetical protein
VADRWLTEVLESVSPRRCLLDKVPIISDVVVVPSLHSASHLHLHRLQLWGCVSQAHNEPWS